MATYYALTSTSGRWTVLGVKESTRQAAEDTARAIIGDVRTAYGTDIERETEHKNLVIVPASGLRRYGFTVQRVEEELERIAFPA